MFPEVKEADVEELTRPQDPFTETLVNPDGTLTKNICFSPIRGCAHKLM